MSERGLSFATVRVRGTLRGRAERSVRAGQLLLIQLGTRFAAYVPPGYGARAATGRNFFTPVQIPALRGRLVDDLSKKKA